MIRQSITGFWNHNEGCVFAQGLMNHTYSEVPNRRACLLRFFRFSFHPARNFSCNKQKIPPCSFINLLSKKSRNSGIFSQPCSFIPVCSSIRDFRVGKFLQSPHQVEKNVVNFWKQFFAYFNALETLFTQKHEHNVWRHIFYKITKENEVHFGLVISVHRSLFCSHAGACRRRD